MNLISLLLQGMIIILFLLFMTSLLIGVFYDSKKRYKIYNDVNKSNEKINVHANEQINKDVIYDTKNDIEEIRAAEDEKAEFDFSKPSIDDESEQIDELNSKISLDEKVFVDLESESYSDEIGKKNDYKLNRKSKKKGLALS